MSLIANSPTDRANQLLIIAERLTVLVVEETAAFVARAPGLPADKADEKVRLANTYRAETTRIAADPSLIAGAPGPLKAKLRQAVGKLETALAEGERAVVGLRTVCEGMVKAMAEEVARQRRASAPYGPSAAPAKPARAHAVTLDQQA